MGKWFHAHALTLV